MATEALFEVNYKFAGFKHYTHGEPTFLEDYTPVTPTGRWKLTKPEGHEEWILSLEVTKLVKQTGLLSRDQEVKETEWITESFLTFRSPKEEQIFECSKLSNSLEI